MYYCRSFTISSFRLRRVVYYLSTPSQGHTTDIHASFKVNNHLSLPHLQTQATKYVYAQVVPKDCNKLKNPTP